MGKHQRFTKEFKLEAVRLMHQSGRPAVEIARELGVRRSQLHRWASELEAQGEGAFPGPGRQAPPAAEVARLKRELARVTEERDILKKAAVGSGGACNSCLQYSCRCLKPQRLPRTLIQA